jgi:hypothetical protein
MGVAARLPSARAQVAEVQNDVCQPALATAQQGTVVQSRRGSRYRLRPYHHNFVRGSHRAVACPGDFFDLASRAHRAQPCYIQPSIIARFMPIASAKKETGNFRARHGVATIVIAILVIVPVSALAFDSIWFDNRDKMLRDKAVSTFSRVVVPSALQFQSREYYNSPKWFDYNPHWIYRYKVIADRKIVYGELKQALIKVCGPNTPETPYKVSGDEKDYSSLGTVNCDGVSIMYNLLDDKNATITLRPLIEAD